MEWKYLKLNIENRVGYLILESGERFNILHRDCITEVSLALAELVKDKEVGCVVLTGSGDSFAVGANIAEMKDFSPLDGLHFSIHGQRLFTQMEEAAKPIIGALNGMTMGGGLDLALSCDIRLASDRLKTAHPGAKLGIITGFCGTQKLPRQVGRNNGREIFMTADIYNAEDALRMDLVDRVYPHEEFRDQVRRYAERIASFSMPALDYAKKLINASQDVDLHNGQVMELGAFSTLISANEFKTGVDRFFAESKSDPSVLPGF